MELIAIKPRYVLSCAELWRCDGEAFVIAPPDHVSSRVLALRRQPEGGAIAETVGSVYEIARVSHERDVDSHAAVEAAKVHVVDAHRV